MRTRRISLTLFTTALFCDHAAVHSFQILPTGGPLANIRANSEARQQQQQQQQLMDLQETLGIPDGLMKTFLKNTNAFHKRIWIIDNSGSMALEDGHQIAHIQSDDDTCSRWKELEETVLLHAQLSSALHQPTEFRLLNSNKDSSSNTATNGILPAATNNKSSPSFQTGLDTMRNSLQQAQTVLSRTSPKGSTPLAESIAKIKSDIQQLLPQLEQTSQRVAVVIVTDGCNHSLQNVGQAEVEINESVKTALESLRGLPVSVVLRLCTDYGPIVDYYNDLDSTLDYIDVVDDYRAEAKEVHQHNPWLNYNLILHRMREMGQYSPLFNLLDERTLTRDELKEFCILLFGNDSDFPDPMSEWKQFLQHVNQLQLSEKLHYNPRTQQMAPWIDIEGLSMLE